MDILQKIWAWLKLAFFGGKKPTITYNFIDNTHTWKPIEIDILKLFNTYRIENNLGILTGDQGIKEKTMTRINDLIEDKRLSHDGFRAVSIELKDEGMNQVAEIVGYGYDEASIVMHAWKNSPGHNSILTTRGYKYVGIATNYDGGTGEGVYYCAIFGN